jgi:hypothetical protein
VADLLKTARAAIEGKRLAEALEALLAARAIDATADGLVELTDQAIRSQAQEARKTSAVPPVETRDRAPTPTGRQRVPTRMPADEEATVFVPAGGMGASERSADESNASSTSPAAVGVEDGERTLIGLDNDEAEARPRRWGLIAGAAILLLIILAALFRLWS